MRLIHPASVLVLSTLLAACGIPRDAGTLAAAAAIDPLPADDDAIRQSLLTQADAWTRLSALLLETQIGGIHAGSAMNSRFTALVLQTAALARRQAELIERNEDTPEENRAILERFQALWRSADAYLNPR
jgi:hypothetical protein